jgi:uncharacterized membrane protein
VDLGTRMHRQLLAVVGVILLGTVAGLIALWPRAEALPEAAEPPEALIEGVVVGVEADPREPDPVLGTSGEVALVDVRVLEGPDEGRTFTLDVQLDSYPEFGVGDRVALTRAQGEGQEAQYFITDFQRLPVLTILVGLFIAAVLLIGRWHGLRSLLGLGLSLLLVVQFIVPAILAGRNPPVVALVGALAVMIVTLYLAHGVNEMTTSAIIGTAGALTLTVGLGLLFISRGNISGFASDDANLARFAVEGLDLQGLVLAGLIIAALGVLDDVTVSQASTVFALHETDRQLPFATLFARAMKVGRDHIASVVNTLFLAYAGASLALLVLFSTSGLATREIVNSEVLAEEIIKTVVGSLGLIAAVPVTTALAAAVAVRMPADAHVVGGHHHHGGVGPSSASAVADADDEVDEELDDEERAARAWSRYLAARGLDDDAGPSTSDRESGAEPGPDQDR